MENNQNQTNSNKVVEMANDLKWIRKIITQIQTDLKEKYVTRTEFDPVKKIVYGMTALVLSSVVGAIIVLIIK